MVNVFKSTAAFLKRNPSIIYSLFLIVLIPLVLYYNSNFTINSFQKVVDFNLQTQAMMAESVFGHFASSLLSSPEELQINIEKVAKENPAISELRIFLPEQAKEQFRIIASKNIQEVGQFASFSFLTLSWYQDQTIANLVGKEGTRFWIITQPIYNNAGDKIGLISMSLSLASVDQLVSKIIFHSYGTAIGAIILTLFLVAHHTRLFGYVTLYKKLQEVDKMKDSFIRMTIHELQSPIVNIRAYLQTLKEEIAVLLNENQEKYFYRIETSSKNLSDLVYDILQVSQIEQGTLDVTPQEISPQRIIKEVIEELKMKAEQKNLQLNFKEKVEPYLISINPLRLRQIIFNLIDNAIKYTLKGKIDVETIADEVKRKYFISVWDNGIGISAEDQKRLFEKFYRIKTKETAEIEGTGLGLWITKELTQKMGGEIFIESMKGIGSKFAVVFPLSKSKLLIK